MPESRIARLTMLFFGFKRALHDRFRARRGHDLASMLRLAALACVAEKGHPPMKEVAEHLCITPPSATSLINSLVAERLLVRTRDRLDRRTVRLGLTPAGRRKLDRGIRLFQDRVAEAVSGLSPREQEQMIRLFKKMLSATADYATTQ